MRLDQALRLNQGQKLIDCFSDPLVVISIESLTDQEMITVIDTSMNRRDYHYTNLYEPDLYEESDDEIYWVYWATKNRQLIMDYLTKGFNYSHIKQIYQQGFLDGFSFQRKTRAEEQLQK